MCVYFFLFHCPLFKISGCFEEVLKSTIDTAVCNLNDCRLNLESLSTECKHKTFQLLGECDTQSTDFTSPFKVQSLLCLCAFVCALCVCVRMCVAVRVCQPLRYNLFPLYSRCAALSPRSEACTPDWDDECVSVCVCVCVCVCVYVCVLCTPSEHMSQIPRRHSPHGISETHTHA